MTISTPTSSDRATDRSGGATLAALGVAAICTSFAGLQIALAAGAPFGEHVWGGSQPRVLSGDMRIVAGGAALVLIGMATVVTRRAGLLGRRARWLTPATWTIAGYFALNTLGNLTSTSDVERFVFGPATALAAGLTAVVARRSSRTGARRGNDRAAHSVYPATVQRAAEAHPCTSSSNTTEPPLR